MGCSCPTAVPITLVGRGRLSCPQSHCDQHHPDKKSPGQGFRLPHQKCRARFACWEHPLLKKENLEATFLLCNATSTSHYFSAPLTFQPFLIRPTGLQQTLYSEGRRHSTCSIHPSWLFPALPTSVATPDLPSLPPSCLLHGPTCRPWTLEPG